MDDIIQSAVEDELLQRVARVMDFTLPFVKGKQILLQARAKAALEALTIEDLNRLIEAKGGECE